MAAHDFKGPVTNNKTALFLKTTGITASSNLVATLAADADAKWTAVRTWAVRNAALQRGLAPLDDPEELGMLHENLAAASLNALALESGVRLHHWRTGNHEVDLLYGDPRAPLAFEIASSLNHPRAGLAALVRSHAEFRGRCYLVAPQAPVAHATADAVGSLPLDTLLLAVYAQNQPTKAERRLGAAELV